MAITIAKKLAIAGAGADRHRTGNRGPGGGFRAGPVPVPIEFRLNVRHRRPTVSSATPSAGTRWPSCWPSELGIDKAKVAEALAKVEDQMHSDMKAERQAALSERLAEAVAEGKLTQEQADAILKASEAGVLPGGPGRMGHGR